jgi:uncharacterized membrane protein (UPF0127 family)
VGLVIAFALDRSGNDRAGPDTSVPTASNRTTLAGFGAVAATVRTRDADDRTGLSAARALCLLLARSAGQRQQGLMHVTDRSLGGHDGMLFSFPEETSGTFWMRNTPMPLSIAFFDTDGVLVSTTDMAPCGDSSSCPAYAADGPYRYALEVPKGRLTALGVTDGASLEVGGRCAPAND